MNYQTQFNEACKTGNLTTITDLLNNFNIDVHANNEEGFRWACERGRLNIVQYLLENNFNIDVHTNNEEGFIWACKNRHSAVVKYILTKTNATVELLKILCKYKCEYFDEIKFHMKNHKHVVKIYDNMLKSCKILFTLYNTINIENTIYFGII